MRYFSQFEIEGMAAGRPAEFREELIACASTVTPAGVVIDTGGEAWLAMLAKYRGPHRAPRIAGVAAPRAPGPAEWGPGKWREIHVFCLTADARAPRTFWRFFLKWKRTIPVIGCSCRSKLAKWLKKNPPNFADPFAWSVALHNFVNAELGKVAFEIQAAVQIYSSAPPPGE